jgi:hypothetical protein
MSKSIVKKSFEGVKMNTAETTSIQESSRIYAILLKDLVKRVFASVRWRCSYMA